MKLSLALIGSVLAGPQMFFIEDGNGVSDCYLFSENFLFVKKG